MKKVIFTFLVLVLTSGYIFAQDLEFRCNMSVQIAEGNFDPATDVVDVRGTLNGWTGGASVLTDDDNDEIYTFVLEAVGADSTIEFKFGGTFGGTDVWENADNRTYTTTGTNDVFEAYFANDEVISITMTVVYECNMEYERVSGRFDPAADTLEIRGIDFGWGPGQMMEPSTLNADIYTFETTQAINEDSTVNGYKYWYNHEGSGVWEGDPNKTYKLTAEDYANGFAVVTRTFNNATLETITNQPTTILFTCDASQATNNAITGNPFGPITSIHIAGAVPPLSWPQGGWPDEDADLLIELMDDGIAPDAAAGDGIFSAEVVFPQYSPLTIQYKYGANWGDTDNNGGGNDNESGVGADHFLELSPTAQYVTVVDTFGVMEGATVTGLGEVDNEVVPVDYSLEQNYPNPFNPSTVIKFNLPEQGMVSLNVYNMLGQKVAELVNEQLAVGSYEFNFDASRLASGVYIYSLRSNNFVQTRKMMLLK